MGFFGLPNEYRLIIHDEIFSLCYFGNGGFTWSDVYNLPVFLRRYYIKKINEVKDRERAEIEKANKGQTPGSGQQVFGPNIKQNPNYNAKNGIPNIARPNISSKSPR